MIRITEHPNNHGFLLLKVPQDLNATMGNFGPATLAVDLRGYVMSKDSLDSLVSYAKFHSIQLLNEVRSKGAPTKAFECGNEVEVTIGGKTLTELCTAPYKAGAIPKFCAACGQPANPVHFDQDEPDIGARCPNCSQVTMGGAAFCPKCGSPMPERHLHGQERRPKSDPQTLADDVADLATRLGQRAHPTPAAVVAEVQASPLLESGEAK